MQCKGHNPVNWHIYKMSWLFEQSGGDIVIDDDALLGVAVIVLDKVRIGKGAVIGAGSVVTRDVPDGAIATGVPARVVKMRSEL